jgi:hypothetical protein
MISTNLFNHVFSVTGETYLEIHLSHIGFEGVRERFAVQVHPAFLAHRDDEGDVQPTIVLHAEGEFPP